MSNEIYPLKKETGDGLVHPLGERSVNQRLAPIFAALADDPDGYEQQTRNMVGNWMGVAFLPETHGGCNDFRLVPKRKTITAEIPVPDNITSRASHGWSSTTIQWDGDWQADEAEKAIRSAMEGTKTTANPLFVCSECGGYMKWDRSKLLMSSPTKYRGTCENCYHIAFAFSKTIDKAMEGK